jgi:hypothetical protein
MDRAVRNPPVSSTFIFCGYWNFAGRGERYNRNRAVSEFMEPQAGNAKLSFGFSSVCA